MSSASAETDPEWRAKSNSKSKSDKTIPSQCGPGLEAKLKLKPTTMSNPTTAGAGLQQQRVLACALCKQRRIKCSRSFPCSNCIQSGVQCVQPTAQQRRRRFAERALLDRLNHYEHLLRQNSISFEPLHGSSPGPAGAAATAVTPYSQLDDNRDDDDGDDGNQHVADEDAHGQSSRKDQEKEAIDIWQSIKRVALDDDEDDDSDGNSTNFDQTNHHVKLAIQANDHLLFGAPNPDVYLPSLHPDQVQIFRLWQVYLDNVNPLLKVTHTPTMQPRIIDAAGDVHNIDKSFEALMFGIYCAAVLSLTDDECLTSFQSSRDLLLARYQVACKQALLTCSPWRSNDRDCLTALYLYMLSVGAQVDPRSLACMVAVAIRIAQRMGIHYESSASGCKALEAEMRRRLWWSLVLFDHRLCEIVSQEKSTSLLPLWDVRPPLNVNDFELQLDMKKPPARHQGSATEALFAVVRSELADFVRRSASYLAILGATPSANMPRASQGDELKVLETIIENKHLAHCNPEVPLHFMTIWTTRSFFARSRLVEHYITHGKSASEQLSDAQRTKAYSYTVIMLDCDTRLRSSPLTQGFLWFVEALHSPILAYLHILNGLTKRPGDDHADLAWVAMCDNYEALVNSPKHHRTRLMFALKFSPLTLQAWEARVNLRRQLDASPEPPPRLVLDATARAAEMADAGLGVGGGGMAAHGGSSSGLSVGLTPASLSNSQTPMSSGGPGSLLMQFPPPNPGGPGAFEGDADLMGLAPPGLSMDMLDHPGLDMDMDQFWADENVKWM